jgi:hypothetical protein
MAKKKEAPVGVSGFFGVPVLKTFGDYGSTSVVLANGMTIYAIADYEGNGPGVLFGDDHAGEFRLVGDERDGFLRGRKIKSIGKLSAKQMKDMMWDGEAPATLVFDDGTRLYASRDPEGNGPGQIIIRMPNGKEYYPQPQGQKDWSPI